MFKRKVSHMPETISVSNRLAALRSRVAMALSFSARARHFGNQSKATSAPAVSTTQSSENGRNTFQPSRINWS